MRGVSEKRIEIACAQCGRLFEAQRTSRLFCSDNCKQRALVKRRSPLVEKACDVCGTLFQQNKRHQRYCSAKCYQRGWTHNNREKYNARMSAYQKKKRAAARIEIQCQGCDTKFVPSHASQVFCTDKCHAAFYVRTHPEQVRSYRDKYHARARVDSPWRYSVMAAKARAKKLGLACDIDAAWGEAQWTGVCALSGLPLEFDNRRHPLTPSIDRIDPRLGYTKNNCRFIAWAVNAMKGSHSDEWVLKIAAAIVANISRKD